MHGEYRMKSFLAGVVTGALVVGSYWLAWLLFDVSFFGFLALFAQAFILHIVLPIAIPVAIMAYVFHRYATVQA
jgi:hypothetical protein